MHSPKILKVFWISFVYSQFHKSRVMLKHVRVKFTNFIIFQIPENTENTQITYHII